MKRIFLATYLVSLLAVTAAKAQQPPATEEALKKVICKKWQISHMELKGKKMDLPAEMKSYMQFYENNTVEEIYPGRKDMGNWKYFIPEKSIGFLMEDGWRKLKIVHVTAEKLILQMGIEKGMHGNTVWLPAK